MVCKESVNLTRKQKSGKPLARIPTQCPVQFWGRSAGQNARQCTTTRRECNQRLFGFGFPNKPSLSVQAHPSFGNHRTRLNRICVHTATDRGSLAGLLVVADDQGELGSMRDAGASTLCRRLVFHMFSAVHRVPYFASKHTVAARPSVEIWKCRRCK